MIIGTTCKTKTVPLLSRARLAAVSSASIELSSKSTGQRILRNCGAIKMSSFVVGRLADSLTLANAVPSPTRWILMLTSGRS